MSHTPSAEAASKLQITTHWLKPLLPATGGETTLLIRLIAAPDPNARLAAPVDVAFVLDRSGSMSGGKLELEMGPLPNKTWGIGKDLNISK